MTKQPRKLRLSSTCRPESPYYRFVFHQESTIDPQRRVVTMFGGQGVLFDILRAILAGSSGSAHRLQGLPILSVIRFLGTRFCFDDGLGWTVGSEKEVKKEQPRRRRSTI